jgi:hypothetical protein
LAPRINATPFFPITYGIVGKRGGASCVLHAASTAPLAAREMLIDTFPVHAHVFEPDLGTCAETTRPATEQRTACPGCNVPGMNQCTCPA